MTTALASLALPSVFRPDANGTLQLDRTVATSAEVVSQNPFTVSYELNLEASWTSGAPIAAEDFVYLWQRMRDEPGVADAAGYRLITDVRSRAAGKAVDVVFSEPYPAWQTLFADLLPAHLLKDAPGSWTGALANGLPASGGPFRVVSVDRARGEVLLTRNDQYWDAPATLAQLVLRRVGGTALTDGLATGDVDIALPEASEAVRTSLGALVPPPRIQTAPQPVVTELALRTDGGPLADTRARQALGAIVDRAAVRAAAAPQALAADAFALAPSQPGYASTAPAGAPAHPDAAAATTLLTAAGWTRGTDGRWRNGGAPVRLVVGAAAERPTDLKVAENVAAQLEAAGIGATVVAPTAVELFGQQTVPPTPPSSTTTTPTADATGTTTPPRPSRPRPPRRPQRPAPRRPAPRPRRRHPRRRRRRRRRPAAHRGRRSRHRARLGLRLRRPDDAQRPARPTLGAHDLLVGPAAAARRAAHRRHPGHRRHDARGRREAALVAGPRPAPVPAGLAAGEHPGGRRGDGRRSGTAVGRPARRGPAVDRSSRLTSADPGAGIPPVPLVPRKVSSSPPSRSQ